MIGAHPGLAEALGEAVEVGVLPADQDLLGASISAAVIGRSVGDQLLDDLRRAR
jgi:hypothetical protein